MKIAIFSDIHSNSVALTKVIQDANKYNIDLFCVLGDIIGYYYNPRKVLNILKKISNIEMIQGNHERMLRQSIKDERLSKTIMSKYGSGIQYAKTYLGKSDIKKLISLPEKKELCMDGLKILLCHGSPFKKDFYIYPDSDLNNLKKCIIKDFDFIFMGHTHYPFCFSYNNTVIANPGSVGQPRDIGNLASYLILNTSNRVLTFHRVRFPISKIVQMVKIIDPNFHYHCDVFYRK